MARVFMSGVALVCGAGALLATWASPPSMGSVTTLRGATAAFHGALTRLEGTLPAGRAHDDAWRAHVAQVDAALGRGDVSAAVQRWHDAYGAALASREWEAMVAVGDAFRRVGVVASSREGAKANARQAYLLALIRARRDGSVDGMLSAARGFAELGDREVTEQCLRIAARLAARHPDEAERERVRAFARSN